MATSFANRSTSLYCDSRTRENSGDLTHVTRNGVFYRSVACEELPSPIAAATTTGAARHVHRRSLPADTPHLDDGLQDPRRKTI